MNLKALFSLTALSLAAAILAAFMWNKAANLQRGNQALQARVVELEQTEHNPRPAQSFASNGNLSQAEKLELMRLRNEVTQLRASAQAAADAEAENARLLAENKHLRENARAANQPEPRVRGLTREHWTFQGYGTPRAAYATALWAAREANADAYLAALTPEARQAFENANRDKSSEQIAADLRTSFESLSAFRVSSQEQVSPTEMDVEIDLQFGERSARHKIRMTSVDNQWKADGPLAPSYDPLTFYRRNPELMRRYFPHLFREGDPQPQTPGARAIADRNGIQPASE